MTTSGLRLTFGLAASTAAVAPLGAQADPTDSRGVFAGAEFRRIRIEDSAATSIQQWSVPIGAVARFGRLTIDLGAAYANSRLETEGRGAKTVSSFTDTQVGLSYTFGRDLVVASVVVNLPTGLDRAPTEDFPVLGAISSPLFGFPVNAHGKGFSATTGLALALPAGVWNVGFAASARVSGRYTPYVDPTGPFSYKPGVEGRARVGVDRIVGRSRLTGGLTVSTFGTDELGTGAVAVGLYRPGTRWLAEAAATTPIGPRATLALTAWHYQRQRGDSVGVVVANRERMTGLGAVVAADLGPHVRLNLDLDGRFATQDPGRGHLYGGEIGLGIDLGRRVTLGPSVRYDLGKLDRQIGDADMRGVSASVLMRVR